MITPFNSREHDINVANKVLSHSYPRRVIASVAIAASTMFAGAQAVYAGAENSVSPEVQTAQDSETEIISFCAPLQSSEYFAQDLEALAEIGVTSVHGPCYKPPKNYTPTEPGERYAEPEEYMSLVQAAGKLGMKVYVYDDRLWSENFSDRQAAVKYWTPVKDKLAGFDMGDEFNIYHILKGTKDELPEVAERWKRLSSWPARKLGANGITNMAPLGDNYQEDVLGALPGIKRIAFNDYSIGETLRNIDFLRNLGYDPIPSVGTQSSHYGSPESAARHLESVFDASVNSAVVFPGALPEEPVSWSWNPLVENGEITEYGQKFKEVIDLENPEPQPLFDDPYRTPRYLYRRF